MPQVHCATGPICHRSDMPHFFHFIPQCKPVILKGWLLETVLWRSVQVCLSVFAVCQSVCLSVSLSLCLLKGLIARNLFIKIGASMSVCLCCLSVCLSICLSVCLSAYLNVLVLQPRPLGRFWYILSLENDTDHPLKFQTISHHTHMRLCWMQKTWEMEQIRIWRCDHVSDHTVSWFAAFTPAWPYLLNREHLIMPPSRYAQNRIRKT